MNNCLTASHLIQVPQTNAEKQKRHSFQSVSTSMILIHYPILLLVKLTVENYTICLETIKPSYKTCNPLINRNQYSNIQQLSDLQNYTHL